MDQQDAAPALPSTRSISTKPSTRRDQAALASASRTENDVCETFLQSGITLLRLLVVRRPLAATHPRDAEGLGYRMAPTNPANHRLLTPHARDRMEAVLRARGVSGLSPGVGANR